jgi:hypothetical protein
MILPNVAVHVGCPMCGMLLKVLDGNYKQGKNAYEFCCDNAKCVEHKRPIRVVLPTVLATYIDEKQQD